MNNASLNLDANHGMPPQDEPRRKVAIMLAGPAHATSLEIARRISSLPELHEQRAEEIKERARAELQALDKEFSALHEAEWNALQIGLGLDPDINYSLCTDHLDNHGVAFVTEQEPESGPEMPSGLDIGGMIAQALGGHVIADGANGGVIAIRR